MRKPFCPGVAGKGKALRRDRLDLLLSPDRFLEVCAGWRAVAAKKNRPVRPVQAVPALLEQGGSLGASRLPVSRVIPRCCAGVELTGTPDPVVATDHFIPVGEPADRAGQRKYHGKHGQRNTDRLENDA